MEAARAGVHRADQHEPCGERRGAGRACYANQALLEWLPQHVERAPRELAHLVEEQHAFVREADLAGTGELPSADERDVRDGVVRRAERPLREEADPRRQQPRDRVHRARLQCLVERQRRQDARHAPRHHRLAGAGWANHEDVVAAGCRDFERAARQGLRQHIGEVRCAVMGLKHSGRDAGRGPDNAGRVVEGADGLGERATG